MGIVDVQGLGYTYPRATAPALRHIDFAVEQGEIFGFLGPNGAGKSTTQKILIRLCRGYTGIVRVLGRDLQQWHEDYYELIGVSFELPNHYLKLTARENLALFASLHRVRVHSPEAVLEAVGLVEDADKPVAAFSKGMKVRLNLARALLHRPTLLFLDEPTAGLDPVTALAIRDVIRQQQQSGVTIFLTTHDMLAADELCSRVAFLVDGEIRALDAPATLKRRYGTRAIRVTSGEGPRAVASVFPVDGLADNAGFLAQLRRADLQTVHTLETSLDDVFVQITGRALT
jgi:fluoroquinolone transport system ATP-binding protein